MNEKEYANFTAAELAKMPEKESSEITDWRIADSAKVLVDVGDRLLNNAKVLCILGEGDGEFVVWKLPNHDHVMVDLKTGRLLTT